MNEIENDQTEQRRRNLEQIVSLGYAAYPHRYDFTHTISQIVSKYAAASREELEAEQVRVRVAGRIRAIRKMGRAAFITYSDGRESLQIYIRSNEVGERTWQLFNLLDLGDLIGAGGYLFRTKTGELSIHLSELEFLAKALLPPPDKYYGLHDKETRYRQRYVDLIANRQVREVFEKRAAIIRETRRFFDERGYLEVETPMLTPLATGAAARPFVTHHNALDITLYARIAPELYLKRLVVGGLDRVYELNRNFRNEGLSIKHNPEFTMLEFYQAYSDYCALMDLTEELLCTLVDKVCRARVLDYGEHKITFERPWRRLTMREAVMEYWPGTCKPSLGELTEFESLKMLAASLGLETNGVSTAGALLGLLFEHVAEPHLIQPTFITEFPIELSPLSKRSEHDSRFADRFELFISNMEIANGFSELNDPVEQKQRFEEQMRLRECGDEEAMVIDLDYVRALSYGMPPTAGEGIGIDRLVMLLTGQRSIRDVILFPHMRPER
ncbi:MAG: lysine--tRNA ligase [Acidobacteriota bacterium]|nr:lysine--tRNA ligase [Blastocatellia bacterium]MDW8411285.1 lysine--tRNA ligase [Acidobacteriota bacterium]